MLLRIPEQELMLDPKQARAYAEADFEQPHSMFIELFQEMCGAVPEDTHVLDLGCGPGDIPFRFARAWQACHVHGVDGSEAMLAHAKTRLAQEAALQGRVRFLRVPCLTLNCRAGIMT